MHTDGFLKSESKISTAHSGGHLTALRSEKIAFVVINTCAYFVLLILFIILSFIVYKGLRYSIIDSSFYNLKEEIYPDDFCIVVNSKQKQSDSISWDIVTGLYDDFFLTWKKIDGVDVYVNPIVPEYTGNLSESFNRFFFGTGEVHWGKLVKMVTSSSDALSEVSKTVGSVTVVERSVFEQLPIELKRKLRVLPVRRYVYIATDKLSNSKNYMGSIAFKDSEMSLNDGLVYELLATEAYNKNLNPVRLTRPKSGWNFSLKFLFTPPDDSGAAGGISSIIVNTIYLLLLTLFFSVPVGLMSSIYFVEYSVAGYFLKILRFGTETLAGIPSIIFGLVGSIIFVNMLGFSFGLLSGALTLTFMILPTIIRTSEEAIIAVPQSLREASFGLGATKIQTIFKVVLPIAIPGIVNGIILAMGRALGETAALIFTMGSGCYLAKSLSGSARGLATHIYLLYAQGISSEKAFATAFVLIVFVLIFNTTSKFVTRKYEWNRN